MLPVAMARVVEFKRPESEGDRGRSREIKIRSFPSDTCAGHREKSGGSRQVGADRNLVSPNVFKVLSHVAGVWTMFEFFVAKIDHFSRRGILPPRLQYSNRLASNEQLPIMLRRWSRWLVRRFLRRLLNGPCRRPQPFDVRLPDVKSPAIDLRPKIGRVSLVRKTATNLDRVEVGINLKAVLKRSRHSLALAWVCLAFTHATELSAL